MVSVISLAMDANMKALLCVQTLENTDGSCPIHVEPLLFILTEGISASIIGMPFRNMVSSKAWLVQEGAFVIMSTVKAYWEN